MELEVELCEKNITAEEAQLKVGQHLKKVNDDVAAAQKKAEKQQQIHLKPWQNERASL